MEFHADKTPDYLHLKASGRLEALTVKAFEEEVRRWSDSGENAILIDFGGLDYISSAGLRSIYGLFKELREKEVSMRFCCLTGMVKDVFKLAGYDKMFTVYETSDEAYL